MSCPPDPANTAMSRQPDPIFHPHAGTQNTPAAHKNFQNSHHGSSNSSQTGASLRPEARIIHGDLTKRTRQSFPPHFHRSKEKSSFEIPVDKFSAPATSSKKKAQIHALDWSAIAKPPIDETSARHVFLIDSARASVPQLQTHSASAAHINRQPSACLTPIHPCI